MEWDPRGNAMGKTNRSTSRREPQNTPQHYALPATMDGSNSFKKQAKTKHPPLSFLSWVLCHSNGKSNYHTHEIANSKILKWISC